MTSTTDRPLARITGASSGIGRELAREFAAHGYDLVVAANEPRIHKAGEELRGAVEIDTVEVDLATDEGVDTFQAVYNASTSFIQPFALALRNEAKGSGVTITARMHGDERVVSHSRKTCAQATLSRVLPDSVKAELHRRQAAPGSGRR